MEHHITKVLALMCTALCAYGMRVSCILRVHGLEHSVRIRRCGYIYRRGVRGVVTCKHVFATLGRLKPIRATAAVACRTARSGGTRGLGLGPESAA